MTAENFCYWLNGFIEINKPEEITREQFEIIKRHLALVMNRPVIMQDKISVSSSGTKEWQDAIDKLKTGLLIPQTTMAC